MSVKDDRIKCRGVLRTQYVKGMGGQQYQEMEKERQYAERDETKDTKGSRKKRGAGD